MLDEISCKSKLTYRTTVILEHKFSSITLGYKFQMMKEGGLSFNGTLVLSESKLDLANTGTNDVFPGKITHKKIGINIGYVW